MNKEKDINSKEEKMKRRAKILEKHKNKAYYDILFFRNVRI